METAGISVCISGYIAINLGEEHAGYWLLETKGQLYDFLEKCGRVFIDIPVGLPDDVEGRECDKLLRERLGLVNNEHIINPPIRGIIAAPTYGEASMMSYEIMEKRLPMPSWNIVSNIKVIDDYIQQNGTSRERIFESHPELLFQILNGGNPVLQRKATKKGLRHRLHLLEAQNKHAGNFFRKIKEIYRRNQIEEDKIINAMVLALFALRSVDQPIKTLPDDPPKDSIGLPMAIHYV